MVYWWHIAKIRIREFVRSIVAVAFLPPNQIEAAVDDLRAIEFDMNSPFIEKTSKFKDDFLDYLESTWMYGNYPVKMWNQWKQYKKLTNNNNEVYSSFFSSHDHDIHFVFVC